MTWRTAKDKHPDRDCQCLCLVPCRGYQLLYWNSIYNVWDDPEGDDYFCDSDEIEAWIPVEELVKLLD